MDPSAPQTVLKGVAITSSLCGVAAGLYGGFKQGTPSKFFLYSAMNSGIVAAVFFSIREYVVSPILVSTLSGRQYETRRQKLVHLVGNSMFGQAPLSWADIRTSCLLDSGISGALAGGMLNTWKRGRRGLMPGFTTGAIMCTLLQWCFNECNIFRIRYISGHTDLINSAQHTVHNSVDEGQHLPADVSARMTTQSAPVELATSHSTMDRILSVFGQRIPDEKYLERLKMERDVYLHRIAEIERKRKQ